MSHPKQEQIQHYIQDSINAKLAVSETMLPDIAAAAELLIDCLKKGNKILCCGNGGSAGDAQHFAAELLGRFETERQGLPALALSTNSSTLTAIANDYSYGEIFSKQVAALGQPNDVLLAISTSGNSDNIVKAIQVAQKQQLSVVALTGKSGGSIKQVLHSDNDIHLCIPAQRTAHIQEAHIMILHCLCQFIDQAFTD